MRVENRVLPAGPTVVDILANGAFYYGLLRVIWPNRTGRCGPTCRFRPARDNFFQGAREGINAQLYWPGLGEVPATELVLRRLLPLARTGLDTWGVDGAVTDRLLGVIERRCTTHQNGAEWQARTFHRLTMTPGGHWTARLAGRDDPPLPRAHAQQRAGPRLAGGLSETILDRGG